MTKQKTNDTWYPGRNKKPKEQVSTAAMKAAEKTGKRCDGFTLHLPWTMRELFNQAYRSGCIAAREYHRLSVEYFDPDTRAEDCPGIPGFTIHEDQGVCYYTPATPGQTKTT